MLPRSSPPSRLRRVAAVRFFGRLRGFRAAGAARFVRGRFACGRFVPARLVGVRLRVAARFAAARLGLAFRLLMVHLPGSAIPTEHSVIGIARMVSRIVRAWLAATVCLLGGGPGGAAGQGSLPVGTLADGRAGEIHFESRTPAGYFALARREASPRVVIVGTLRLPKDAAGRVPAMVIAHGSGGVDTREAAWADRLGALGLATFVVDSFTPRNVRETATDQARLPTAANVADALAALRLLATHQRINPDRIGIIGFSKGGQVALYTPLEPFRRAVIDDDRRFAAHVALYPYCSDWYTAARVTGAPMLLLLGGRDDYTPAEACRGYAEWFRTAGAETAVVTYPDSYHDFDAYRAPRFERALVTGRGCDMAVDLDHFTVTRRGTGEDITATAGRYGRECLARGATIGGDAEARRRAPDDVAAFLRRVLRPETH